MWSSCGPLLVTVFVAVVVSLVCVCVYVFYISNFC